MSQKEKGISGPRFLFIAFSVFLAMIGIGLTTLPNEVALAKLQNMPDVFKQIVTWISFVVVIGSLYNLVVFTGILDIPLWHFGQWLRRARNDSHAILFVACYILAAVPVLVTIFTKSTFWLFEMLIAIPTGHIVALTMVTLVVGSVGTRSLDHLKRQIEAEDNDSHAILVSGLYLVFFTITVATVIATINSVVIGGA